MQQGIEIFEGADAGRDAWTVMVASVTRGKLQSTVAWLTSGFSGVAANAAAEPAPGGAMNSVVASISSFCSLIMLAGTHASAPRSSLSCDHTNAIQHRERITADRTKPSTEITNASRLLVACNRPKKKIVVKI